MPVYEFIDESTDERVELFMPMSEAPSFGTVIEHEGRQLRRIHSDQQVREEFEPYVAYSKPPGLPGCPIDKKSGRSVITSRKQEREVAKRRGEVWA